MKAALLTAFALLSCVQASGHHDHAPHPTITPSPTIEKRAAASPSPLTDYTYAYSQLPYQVNPFQVGRGPQSGYNVCNGTTEGPDSQCQTAILNSLSDFCLWGSPTPTDNGTIGDIEAAVVAYCTDNTHGARLMPAGTITAAQWMVTKEYIQVVGLLNQTGINLVFNDTGGELDPHGADALGNPLGGMVYSTAFPGGNNATLIQVVEWNNFVGSGQFCFKMCLNPSQGAGYCENRYDLIGCAYNAPASYTPDEFTSCEGELQDIVGTYTSAGKTLTWSQPSSLPADSVLPWTPRIPSSSNCVTYQSTDLFKQATNTLGGATSTPSATTTSSGTKTGSSGAKSTSSGATSTSTSAGATTTSSKPGAASTLRVSFGALFVIGGMGAALLA